MQLSGKARENGEKYALLTAQNAAAAVQRRRTAVRQLRLLGRYRYANGNFVLVEGQAASFSPTASSSWSRSSTTR